MARIRTIKPEFFIAVGICSHLGCSPVGPLAANTNPTLGGDAGGFKLPAKPDGTLNHFTGCCGPSIQRGSGEGADSGHSTSWVRSQRS